MSSLSLDNLRMTLCQEVIQAGWDLRWRRSLVASVYARPHCGQGKGLSPECRRSWARSVCGSRSAFPHTGHRWASPVWEMRWRRSSGRCGKASAQCGQRYGRSPVCSRRCPRRLPRWRKARPQCGHGKGFSPVCSRMWFRSEPWLARGRPHTGQGHGVGAAAAWCVLRCSRREGRRAKALPHCSQVKGRAPEWTTWCSLRSRRVPAKEGLVARVHERVLLQVAELQEGLAALPTAVSTQLGGPVRRGGTGLTPRRALLGSGAALRLRWRLGLGRVLLVHAVICRQRAKWLVLLGNRGLGLGRNSGENVGSQRLSGTYLGKPGLGGARALGGKLGPQPQLKARQHAPGHPQVQPLADPHRGHVPLALQPAQLHKTAKQSTG
ncbi:TPA: hypothetical protein BOS_15182 [Bos taurus]|nr:TPA: hypothetical protein BOS_15182 [Bos taurus]